MQVASEFALKCEHVMPIWARHIATARQQMESAVSALTGRFAGVVRQFEQSTLASQSASGNGC